MVVVNDKRWMMMLLNPKMGAKTWNKIVAIIAIEKLDKIPAADTKSSPFFISEKFKGLTGTGFAQAIKNLTGAPEIKGNPISIKGKRTEPTGSM